MNNLGSVHLVIPCFWESERIVSFLAPLAAEMQLMQGVSILVVEDGSGAYEAVALRRVVDNARSQYPCLLPMLELPQNFGKGGAVYEGWGAHHDQEWLMFVDADGSIQPSEVRRLIEYARFSNQKKTALFGSRIKMLGKKVERLLQRHLIGRVYATLVSEILGIDVYDSQCGLKMVPRQDFEQIRDHLVTKGFAFDVELMVSLLDSGCMIEEFPIDWKETPGGKVRLLTDSFRMFVDILEIKRRRKSPRA